MRLIDADALLEAVKVIGNRPLPDVRTLKDLEQAIVNTYHAILNEVTNAPTVQREGWVSVPIEPTEEMIQAACINQAVNSFNSYEEWAESHSSGIVEKIRSLEINTYKAMIQAAPTDTE